jgi:CBS domain containing-hemolysin-like protein
MLLVPPYLLWVRAARPVIAVYDWCAHVILRAVGVEAKSELENTVSTLELSEMIAESLSEGLLDPEEHNRLSRALRIRNRVVADVALPLRDVHAVPVAADEYGPTVAAIQSALAETGYSRFPVVDSWGRFIGYVHIKDVLPAVDDPDAVVDLGTVRPLPEVPETTPLPDALSLLRRENSHLALVTAADGGVSAIVTLEDLVEDVVGAVRDRTHRA